MTKYIFSLSLLLAALLPLAAQNPGSLDTTFANHGVLLTTVSNYLSFANGIAVQSNNRIIICGSVKNTGESYHGVMLRYMPDGKGLDSTFGVNGWVDSYVDTLVCPGGSGLYKQILLTDGRILAQAGTNFATKRFLSDGRNDSSFQGIGLIHFPPSTAGIEGIVGGDMKLQTDGKIVRAGTALLNTWQRNVIISRFTTDGDLDTTFGPSHQAYVMTDLSPWGFISAFAYNVVIQSDGKIVVVGMAEEASKDYEFLLRYNSNGTLDSTFGNNGLVSHNFSNNDYWGGGFALLQSDDKILVGVQPLNAQFHQQDLAIIRFLPTGKVDSSYGTNGIIYKQFNLSGSNVQSSLLFPDNSLLVSATYTDDDSTQIFYRAFLHYDTDGHLDPNFYYTAGDCIFGLAFDNYGKILGSGGSFTEFGMNRFFSGLNVGIAVPAGNNLALRLFPNPAEKIVNLNYTLSSAEKVSISLWNQQGQKIYIFQENQPEGGGTQTHPLSIPDYLPNGIYFIQVTTSKFSSTTKWIK